MTSPAVCIDRFAFGYPDSRDWAVCDIDFELEQGSWTWITGPTGSGKSTLLKAIAGLIPHQSSGRMRGRVLLEGHDTRDLAPRERAERAVLVLQSPDDQLCATSVEMEIAFGLENLAVDPAEIDRRIDESLARVGLKTDRQTPPQHLSGGEKQRLLLAALLAMHPRVLVCDEPLSQLDSQAAAEFLNLLVRLQRDGLTIVMAEHRLDDVWPLADRLLVMREGRIAADCAARDNRSFAEALRTAGMQLPDMLELALAINQPHSRTSNELIASLHKTDSGAPADRGFEPSSTEQAGARRAGNENLCADTRDRSLAAPSEAKTTQRDAELESTTGKERLPAIEPTTSRGPDRIASSSMSFHQHEVLNSSAADPANRLLLRVRELAFRYDTTPASATRNVWENVSFDLSAGERVAVVGSNGAGKSTLLALLAGLEKPSRGTIEGPAAVPGACGLVMQNPDLMLFCRTVRDELAFGPRHRRGADRHEAQRSIQRLAEIFDLACHLERPPLALSQGQRLRLAIAATLASEPQLLLLDEPTIGQDREQIDRIMRAVQAMLRDTQPPGALVFSTHDLRTVARYADRVLVLGGGRLLADTRPIDLLEDETLLATARLRRPPMFELRHRLRLQATTPAGLIRELAPCR